MCKWVFKLFKKKVFKKQKLDEKIEPVQKEVRKRPGPIITNVEDFTTVSKYKKKEKILFKHVGEHGIKI